MIYKYLKFKWLINLVLNINNFQKNNKLKYKIWMKIYSMKKLTQNLQFNIYKTDILEIITCFILKIMNHIIPSVHIVFININLGPVSLVTIAMILGFGYLISNLFKTKELYYLSLICVLIDLILYFRVFLRNPGIISSNIVNRNL
jgi:hypothetical protein